LVTGLDLVHLQIAIAEGKPLPFTQDEITLRGHALEVRVYAEDPETGFPPSPGKITRLVRPGGPGIREDEGVYEDWEVPTEYDPMLSKLIAFAPDRATAIARLGCALDEYVVGGIRTNLKLLRRILNDPNFRAARIDTGYLDRLLVQPVERNAESATHTAEAAMMAGAILSIASAPAPAANHTERPWQQLALQRGLRP
jgi:acetyl-CoA carboxylase, biotin carboxylase subunit